MDALMRSLTEYTVAFTAGAAVLMLPVMMDPAHERYSAAVFPMVRDAVEGVKPLSLLLLLVLGGLLGVSCTSRTVPLAAATVAIFPVWSILDVAFGGGSHHLLPVEWLIYAFYAVIVGTGLKSVRWLRSWTKGR